MGGRPGALTAPSGPLPGGGRGASSPGRGPSGTRSPDGTSPRATPLPVAIPAASGGEALIAGPWPGSGVATSWSDASAQRAALVRSFLALGCDRSDLVEALQRLSALDLVDLIVTHLLPSERSDDEARERSGGAATES